jgi:hypothetical protein
MMAMLVCLLVCFLQGLTSLRVLDVGGNQLRRVEVLATCRGLAMMTDLNIAGNPLEAAQDARLHVVHLLTQVGLKTASVHVHVTGFSLPPAAAHAAHTSIIDDVLLSTVSCVLKSASTHQLVSRRDSACQLWHQTMLGAKLAN